MEDRIKMTNQKYDIQDEKKTIFDLKLPKGSKCIALSCIKRICICAVFHVPGIGIEIYVLNPNTGKTIKVEGFEP